jgi:ribosomal protein S18 acetylase RimI-like enzyme
MSYSIRGATPEDSTAVAPLILSAYEGFANFICATDNRTLILERLARLFSYPKPTMVHYSNYSIAENTENGDIVGIVGCLRGDFIPIFYLNLAEALGQFDYHNDERLQETIRAVVQTREALDDEFYLDVLAVSPDYQGKGIANLLLDEAYKRAVASNMENLVLLARSDLKDFYIKKGFAFYEQRKVGSSLYNVMYKELIPAN